MAIQSKNFQDLFVEMYPELIPGEDTFITKSVTFVVTENCQFNCSYCYQTNKSKKSMSLETAKKIIDTIFDDFADTESETKIFDDRDTKAIILEFIGGEPFLKIDLIDEITEYYKWKAVSVGRYDLAINYMLSTTTNGGLALQPKVLDFIEKNKERFSVSITIDGNKELHDTCRRLAKDGGPTYDLVEKAVKHYRDNFGLKTTKLTLAPENIEYLTDALENLWDLGIYDVHANTVYENVWENKHAIVFYEQLKNVANYLLEDENFKFYAVSLFDESIGQPMPETDNNNWCGGTGKMLAFDVRGVAYPCLRYMEYCTEKDSTEFILGDAENGLLKTDCHSCAFSGLEEITRRSQSTDECFYCPVASGCGWCSAYNYEETGSANKRVTYICPMHKVRTLANAYYFNSLSLIDKNTQPFKINLPEQDALSFITKEEYDSLKALEKEAFEKRSINL